MVIAQGWRCFIVALIGMVKNATQLPSGVMESVLTCDKCGKVSRPLWWIPDARMFRCAECPLPTRPA